MRGTTKKSMGLDPLTIGCVQGLMQFVVLNTEEMNVQYCLMHIHVANTSICASLGKSVLECNRGTNTFSFSSELEC